MSGEGSRPGTATRPGTSGSMRKDWVNPLDVHFAKDMAPFSTSSSNLKSGSGSVPKSPLAAQAEFWLGPGGDDKAGEGSLDGPTGYPSPPQSVRSSDQSYSPNSPEPKAQPATTRPAAPSNLRRVNTAEETRLPSPAASDDRGDGLMIQNASSKRETMNFHGPKRTDESARKQWKEKSEQERMAIKRRRQTEGFEGNFAAFNFGAVDLSMPMPPASFESVSDQRPQSSAGSKHTASTSEKRSTGESTQSESVTSQDTWAEQQNPQKTGSKPLDPWTDALPQIPSKGHSKQMPSEVSSHQSFEAPSLHSMASRSIHARGDSDTRSPGTPTALRAFPAATEQASASSPQSQHRGRATDKFDAPPRVDPDRRSQSPLRSRGPMEGDFPVSKGLPRGRRPAPGPIKVPSSSASSKPPSRPAREDETSSTLPSWADRSERHLSAMPAPLTPLGTSPNFMSNNPWAKSMTTSSPVAPRIPSPTFPSLKKSMSSSNENLSSGFEMSFEEEIANSLGHHMLSDLGSPTSISSTDTGRRVEKKTAPPRPPPITLPPGKNGPGGGTPTGSLKSPVKLEFSTGFI